MRSTRDVVEAHLECRKAGDLERDLRENYAPDVVVLTWGEGAARGIDALRRSAHVLNTYLPVGSYEYDQVLVEDQFAMLQWRGRGRGTQVHDGADSYVVRDGRIVAQTIHYATRDIST
ncbi:nuclear transport factor 2 family protein [Cellulomonas sp. C5510]|uniref:nuclear transport factor 2 family protein n=1 Tax=Cellulomonas sp. C5510 TaxID=2871170 RepID=UPI001C93F31C|nr:nuclear transport factor 2 family protein [Cellulomonas sp. C5510]QZN84187.1 nuclear transport factor 2 family protein [Cellulomonas sp. C5510]